MTHHLVFVCSKCGTDRRYGSVDYLEALDRAATPFIPCATCKAATRHTFGRLDSRVEDTLGRMRPASVRYIPQGE